MIMSDRSYGMFRRWGMGAVVLVAACSTEAPHAQISTPGGQCHRPGDAAFRPGAVIEVRDVPSASCVIVLRETNILLRADPTGARPDPGPTVVRDGRGRYYTTNASGFPATINLWNEEGQYVSTFGRPGDGPGEFTARGDLNIHVDVHDRVHVRDGAPNWSVFSPDQEFLWRTSAALMGGNRGATAVLDDGTVLTSQYLPSHQAHYFRVVDSTGVVQRAIAPIDPQLVSMPYIERPIAYASGATFWAGPPTVDGYGPDGYLLQEWTVSGELVRSIRRNAPWFPVSWPRPARQSEGGSMPRPPTQVAALHVDDTGLLLVFIPGPSEQWRSMTYREFSQLEEEERNAMFQVVVDVIDTRAGVLLASQRYSGAEARETLEGLIPNSRFAAAYRIGNDLLPTIQILEYDLVSR